MKRWLYFLCFLTVLSVVLAPMPVRASELAREDAYIVQPGDSLNRIARRYGISVSSLAAANGLSWNSWVYSGQYLTIPGASSPAPAPVATSGSYVVRAGDTLTSIALRHGVSPSQLASANGLYWNSWVYVGQRLTIPGQQSSSTPPQTSTSGTYIVKAGNTLFSIAKWHGVTVSALKAANGLASNTIYVGQRLVIPGSGTSPQPTPVPPAQPTPAPGTNPGSGKWIDIDLTNQRVTSHLIRLFNPEQESEQAGIGEKVLGGFHHPLAEVFVVGRQFEYDEGGFQNG